MIRTLSLWPPTWSQDRGQWLYSFVLWEQTQRRAPMVFRGAGSIALAQSGEMLGLRESRIAARHAFWADRVTYHWRAR